MPLTTLGAALDQLRERLAARAPAGAVMPAAEGLQPADGQEVKNLGPLYQPGVFDLAPEGQHPGARSERP